MEIYLNFIYKPSAEVSPLYGSLFHLSVFPFSFTSICDGVKDLPFVVDLTDAFLVCLVTLFFLAESLLSSPVSLRVLLSV